MINKTYLFDFDGTLVDSMPTFTAVMLKILNENNIKYDENIVKIITPLGYKGTAEYFVKLGLNDTVDGLVTKMKAYAQVEYANNIPLKNGVKETLIALKEKGESLNVLTASPHEALDCCLKRLEVYDLFTNVWSCDDFNTTKANPEIYVMAAKRLGLKVSDVIFVDDNVNAVKTAMQAGMIGYGIYDYSSKDYVEEFKQIADKYLDNFKGVL